MNVAAKRSLVAALLVGTLAAGPAAARAAEPIDEQDAYEIGVEAYTYLYPLVLLDATRRQAVNVEPGKVLGRGPMNAFTHVPVFPPAEFRDVVRPNFDTLYSLAWLDLTKEPMVVSAPDTEGRYYMLPMLDMWSDVFACPGKRTTGTGPGRFALVPPGWQGTLPEGVQRIDAPTPYVWVVGRTQTNGTQDYDAVHKVQAGYTVTPLSQLGKTPQPVPAPIDPTVDMKTPPMTLVDGMDAGKFLAYAAELLKVNPPHVTDQPIVARMRRIGLEVGKSFDLAEADASVRRALERAAPDALAAMRAKIPTLAPIVNGWQMNTDTMGVYGTYYLKRAIVALVGLGANLPEDAVYPMNVGDAEGKPLVGANRYAIHFAKDEIPPAKAFWSVTLYDEHGFPTANELKRNAIGDRDALQHNADGSLDLYIQHDSPGAEKESNWLPAPAGAFNLTMRIYAPMPRVLDGRWAPPAVRASVASESSTTASPPGAGASVRADGVGARPGRFDSMHKTRFVEIFLAHRDAKTGEVVAECYNSMFTGKGIPASKDTAPQASVEGLDFARLKDEYGVLGASLNGPKVWLPDWTEIDMGVERDFNGIKASWVARLNMGDNVGGVAESTPYEPMTIARKSGLGWNKGTTVLLLDDAEGNTWIMKGFQLGLRPRLTYEQFVAAGAGNFRKLPPGWKVRTTALEKDYVEVPVTGVATIMADEFFNVYDKTGPGMGNFKP